MERQYSTESQKNVRDCRIFRLFEGIITFLHGQQEEKLTVKVTRLLKLNYYQMLKRQCKFPQLINNMLVMHIAKRVNNASD